MLSIAALDCWRVTGWAFSPPQHAVLKSFSRLIGVSITGHWKPTPVARVTHESQSNTNDDHIRFTWNQQLIFHLAATANNKAGLKVAGMYPYNWYVFTEESTHKHCSIDWEGNAARCMNKTSTCTVYPPESGRLNCYSLEPRFSPGVPLTMSRLI